MRALALSALLTSLLIADPAGAYAVNTEGVSRPVLMVSLESEYFRDRRDCQPVVEGKPLTLDSGAGSFLVTLEYRAEDDMTVLTLVNRSTSSGDFTISGSEAYPAYADGSLKPDEEFFQLYSGRPSACAFMELPRPRAPYVRPPHNVFGHVWLPVVGLQTTNFGALNEYWSNSFAPLASSVLTGGLTLDASYNRFVFGLDIMGQRSEAKSLTNDGTLGIGSFTTAVRAGYAVYQTNTTTLAPFVGAQLGVAFLSLPGVSDKQNFYALSSGLSFSQLIVPLSDGGPPDYGLALGVRCGYQAQIGDAHWQGNLERPGYDSSAFFMQLAVGLQVGNDAY